MHLSTLPVLLLPMLEDDAAYAAWGVFARRYQSGAELWMHSPSASPALGEGLYPDLLAALTGGPPPPPGGAFRAYLDAALTRLLVDTVRARRAGVQESLAEDPAIEAVAEGAPVPEALVMAMSGLDYNLMYKTIFQRTGPEGAWRTLLQLYGLRDYRYSDWEREPLAPVGQLAVGPNAGRAVAVLAARRQVPEVDVRRGLGYIRARLREFTLGWALTLTPQEPRPARPRRGRPGPQGISATGG